MNEKKKIDVWYSLQSDYCYFLLDRLVALAARDVDVVLRPVLGIVLRMPEATRNRSNIEQHYFETDTARTAAFLDLPYAYPNPSPIEFEPRSLWIAAKEQPRIERLYRLWVGANRAGKGLEFLDKIGRGMWNGRNAAWDTSMFLADGMAEIGCGHDQVLSDVDWDSAAAELNENHLAMLAAGHWGVPLMVYESEPFYGQDRFDQLLWRMKLTSCDRTR